MASLSTRPLFVHVLQAQKVRGKEGRELSLGSWRGGNSMASEANPIKSGGLAHAQFHSSMASKCSALGFWLV